MVTCTMAGGDGAVVVSGLSTSTSTSSSGELIGDISLSSGDDDLRSEIEASMSLFGKILLPLYTERYSMMFRDGESSSNLLTSLLTPNFI